MQVRLQEIYQKPLQLEREAAMNGNEALASAILGAVLPLIISLLKRVAWGRPAKIALAAGLSLVLAIVVNLVASGFSAQVIVDWGIIFATASTIYTALLEKAGLEQRLRGW